MGWVLGVAGGIGSGKTAATDFLAQQGIQIVDSDLIARQVVMPGQPALQKIHQHFGDQVLTADGELNRPWLRQQVFANPDERKWLESVTHPAIRQETIAQLQASTSPYTVLVAPLFFESGLEQLVDRTLLVDVPVEMQVERASRRDQNNEEQIRSIIAAQMSREERTRRADDLVDNSGSLEALQTRLMSLHQQYLALAAAANTK